MESERKPINTFLADIVDPDPTSRIDLADCTPGALYGGIGGNIGRLAICRGEHTAGRIAFEGYQVLTDRNGWTRLDDRIFPILRTEAYLPTETTGAIFRPTRSIAETTPSLSGDPLLDWLIVKDLEQAELRLKDLKSQDKLLRKTPFMAEEISRQKELIAHLRSLRLY
jgi:hypothetical protein